MGVADSLRKARNLRPVTDMLNELAREQERQESFKNVLSIVDKIKNNMNQFQNTPTNTEQTFVPGQKPQVNLSSVSEKPQGLNNNPLNADKLGMPTNGAPPSTKLNPFKMSDIGGKTIETGGELPGAYETEKYYDDQTYDFMKQFYSNPDNTPEAGQLGMNLLSMIKPKSNTVTVGQEDPEKRTVATDRYGKRTVLDEGTGKKSETSFYEQGPDGKPKAYKLENGQTAYKKLTRDKNGNVIKEDYEEQRFAPAPTNVYVEDKYPEINLANLKQDLAENRSNYDYWDKESKDITKSEKERKKAQEQKSIIMGKIEGVTNGIMSQVNAKAPGFEGVVTGLMGIIGKDANKIDSTVETYMKGKNPDLIRWAKEILHQRIF